MKDLTRVLTTPSLWSKVRDAMRKSPAYQAEETLPQRLVELLAELDRKTDGAS